MTLSKKLYQKFRKGCLISYAKFQHDTPHSSGCIAKNLRGESHRPPCARARPLSVFQWHTLGGLRNDYDIDLIYEYMFIYYPIDQLILRFVKPVTNGLSSVTVLDQLSFSIPTVHRLNKAIHHSVISSNKLPV